MIYILHGDDTVSSRRALSLITSQYGSVQIIDAEKAGTSDVSQAISTSDLFLEKKCVVIEKVLKLPKKEQESILKLDTAKSAIDLVLWHNTELSKVYISKFKNAKAESFVLPKLFFTFLDNLTPSNFKREFELRLKMENVEAEQIFYAMVKRIRQLLQIKLQIDSSEVSKMSPWQADKLKSQSRMWSSLELQTYYSKLFEIEKKIKSSGLFLPLKKHLDILLLSEVH